MDDIEYPPMGPMNKHLADITPVNCTGGPPVPGTTQFDDILHLIDFYQSVRQQNIPTTVVAPVIETSGEENSVAENAAA